MATRLTVHVRHTDKSKMFVKTKAVETYYYKENGQEILIGNKQSLDRLKIKPKGVYMKLTKARRRIVNTYAYVIESMKQDVVKSHVTNILSNLKAKGYTFKKEHYYLSNAYCN